jgi:putative peptide zinc metalloprotease protein
MAAPMSAALFSDQWYRVAAVRPRLRSQVRVQRQPWRTEVWYLLSDTATGRQHRINGAAYRFIGRCDGQHSVDEVWAAVLDAEADAAPTQDEVVQLLGQLGELGLLQSERAADTHTLLQRRGAHQRQRRRALLNPFSFRLSLGDPAPWLLRLDPLAHLLFRPLVFWAWLLVVLASGCVALTEWPALRSHAAVHLFNPAHLGWAWLVYPLMKALHELGHALAVRRWGGEVHEFGIALMFLVPAPYVDASAATAFASRGQRVAVGAAGVMVELGLATLGFWIWLTTQPGFVNQLAFGVMLLGTASTLLFNGNPLLRFDAYHVLCDLFELPNLGSRSAAWWSQHLGRGLLGSRAVLPAFAPSERKWLWAYAPLSLAYRVVLSITLVLWLGGLGLLLGLAALAYVGVTLLLQPLRAWVRQAFATAQPGREQARLRLRLAALGAVVVMAVWVVPLPLSTVAPAIVWVPENAQVRPEVEGFIAELPLADGAQVRPGDLLVRLSNPELLAQREQLASRLEGLRVGQFQQLLGDTPAAQNLALDIERAQADVQRADERIALLHVHAQTAGTLAMPRQGDLLGSFLHQGQTLGHVLAPGALRVRAVVAEADAALVQRRTRATEVRLADAPGETLHAERDTESPAATRQLPSAALADAAGGPYPTDPTERDGLHSLQPLFLIDVQLPGHPLARVGGRAWVRFELGHEPLAAQLYRRASQLFLRHFAPAA